MAPKKTRQPAAPGDDSQESTPGYGDRIRAVRRALDIKQIDFAARMGATPQNISEIEKGAYNPGIDLIKKIAKEYDVNLYYLIFGEGEMIISPEEFALINPSNDLGLSEYEKDFFFLLLNSRMIRFQVLCNWEQLLSNPTGGPFKTEAAKMLEKRKKQK